MNDQLRSTNKLILLSTYLYIYQIFIQERTVQKNGK